MKVRPMSIEAIRQSTDKLDFLAQTFENFTDYSPELRQQCYPIVYHNVEQKKA